MREITVAATPFACSRDLPANASRDLLTARFDLDAIAGLRRTWGHFRDRRPETCGALATLDGGV